MTNTNAPKTYLQQIEEMDKQSEYITNAIRSDERIGRAFARANDGIKVNYLEANKRIKLSEEEVARFIKIFGKII